MTSITFVGPSVIVEGERGLFTFQLGDDSNQLQQQLVAQIAAACAGQGSRGRGRPSKAANTSVMREPVPTREWMGYYVGLPRSTQVEDDPNFMVTKATVKVPGMVQEVYLDPSITMGSLMCFANEAHGDALIMQPEHFTFPLACGGRSYPHIALHAASHKQGVLELTWPYEASTNDPHDLAQFVLCTCSTCKASGLPHVLLTYR
jgi:hypothetical protein